MSDNVSQLQLQKKPGLGKRIAAFVLLAVLVAGGVAAYVFRDQLNLDVEEAAALAVVRDVQIAHVALRRVAILLVTEHIRRDAARH